MAYLSSIIPSGPPEMAREQEPFRRSCRHTPWTITPTNEIESSPEANCDQLCMQARYGEYPGWRARWYGRRCWFETNPTLPLWQSGPSDRPPLRFETNPTLPTWQSRTAAHSPRRFETNPIRPSEPSLRRRTNPRGGPSGRRRDETNPILHKVFTILGSEGEAPAGSPAGDETNPNPRTDRRRPASRPDRGRHWRGGPAPMASV